MDAWTYDCGALLRGLTTAPRGTPYVEQQLGRLAALHRTDELVLVVDDPVVGRQVLRPDGAPLRSAWQQRIATTADAGLHLHPSPPLWDPAASPLVEAAALALRLDRFERRATTDPLTGVTNRRGFERALTRGRERHDRTGVPLTVVIIDVDGMKQLNDRDGHAAGDALLVDIARQLVDHARVTDAVARLGGDEFALVLEDAAPGSHELLIRRVEREIARISPVPVGLSAGAARCPEDGTDTTALAHLADRRMYRNKLARRDRNVSA